MSITTSWFQQDAGDEKDVAEQEDTLRSGDREFLNLVDHILAQARGEVAVELAEQNLKVAQEELRTAQEASDG